MLDENELLFDELYEKTKDCGRVQFINLLMEKERENQELKEQLEVGKEQYNDLVEEKENLQEQLDYLRGGEYLNQLRFERDMLQHVVDNSEVSKVDKEFINMTHKNTELLSQQKEFIDYLDAIISYLENDIKYYENNYTPTGKYLKETRTNQYNCLLQMKAKYKEIIGVKDE